MPCVFPLFIIENTNLKLSQLMICGKQTRKKSFYQLEQDHHSVVYAGTRYFCCDPNENRCIILGLPKNSFNKFVIYLHFREVLFPMFTAQTVCNIHQMLAFIRSAFCLFAKSNFVCFTAFQQIYYFYFYFTEQPCGNSKATEKFSRHYQRIANRNETGIMANIFNISTQNSIFFQSYCHSHKTIYRCLTASYQFFSLQLRDIGHENLVNFVGACVEFDKVLILTSYCSKGSLQVGTIIVIWQEKLSFLLILL